jgi:hypothetical protein
MKRICLAMLAIGMLAASPASAKSAKCGATGTDQAGQACADKPAAPAASSTKQPGTGTDDKFRDPLDLLKIENDKLSARLKGICRGC